MYILDFCLTRAISISLSDEKSTLDKNLILEKAVQIPDMLESCYSMLMAPVSSLKAQEVYLPHVSSVLFQFASLRKEIGGQLMNALLSSGDD